MKHLLIAIMLFLSINMHGQNSLQYSIPKDFDKMGIDSSELLNGFEVEYFNEWFSDKRYSFDFKNKKVCFFGPGGLAFSDKQKYFINLKENNYIIQSELLIFDAIQKEESGGYDAAIVYWSKIVIPIEKIVKKLKERH